jgi:glutamyl-tRNA synthetase
MIQCFSLERIHKAPASFDSQKLFAFQEHYIRLEPLERKVDLSLPYLQRAGLLPPVPSAAQWQTVHRVVQAAGERLKVAGDILEYAYCFIADEHVRYDEAAFEQRLRTPPEAAGILWRAQASLQTVEPFTDATLEQWLQEFIQAEGIRAGQIVHALRVAVTGKTTGFGLFDSLAILGKPQCLARIERALARL